MYSSTNQQINLSLRQIPNFYPETFLYYLEKGNIEAVQFHLDYGQDPNEPLGGHGRRPIHIAEKIKNLDILKLLLKSGATYTVEDYRFCAVFFDTYISMTDRLRFPYITEIT